MSLLGDVTSAVTGATDLNSVMGSPAGQVALAAIPGVGQYIGQQQTNAANAQMANEQMQFQEQMSNTSYQRAVADMRAAGLNPALAYQQGGASTPGGAMATMQSPISSAASGFAQGVGELQQMAQIKQVDASVDNTKQQTDNLQTTQGLISAQTAQALQAASTSAQDADLKSAQASQIRKMTPAQYAAAMAGVASTKQGIAIKTPQELAAKVISSTAKPMVDSYVSNSQTNAQQGSTPSTSKSFGQSVMDFMTTPSAVDAINAAKRSLKGN